MGASFGFVQVSYVAENEFSSLIHHNVNMVVSDKNLYFYYGSIIFYLFILTLSCIRFFLGLTECL